MRLYLQLSSALSVLVGVLSLFGMLRAQPPRAVVRGYGLFGLVFVASALCALFWLLSMDASEALVWCKIEAAVAGFVGLQLVIFMGCWIPSLTKPRLILAGYILAAAQAVCALAGNLIVAGVVPRFGLPYWPLAGPAAGIFVIAYLVGLVAVAVPVVHTFRGKARGAALQKMRVFSIVVFFGLLGGATYLPGFLGIPVPPYAVLAAPVAIWAMTLLLWPRSVPFLRISIGRAFGMTKEMCRLGSYFEDYPSAYLSYNLVAGIMAILCTPVLVLAAFGPAGLSDGSATARTFLTLGFLILAMAALLPSVQRFVRGWTELDAPTPDDIANAARHRDVAHMIESLAGLVGGPMVLYRRVAPDAPFLDLAASSSKNLTTPRSIPADTPLLAEARAQRTYFRNPSGLLGSDSGLFARDWTWLIPVVEEECLTMLAAVMVNSAARSSKELDRTLASAQIILYQFSFNERMRSVLARRSSDTSVLQTGQLAAKIAHELRTPLTVLDIYFAQSRLLVEIMAKSEGKRTVEDVLAEFPYDVRDLLSQTERYAAARLRVDATLEATRPFTDAQIRAEVTSLSAVLRDAELLCRTELHQAEASLIQQIPGDVMVRMDRGTALQIFANLVRNAAEAIEEAGGGGFVTISHEERPEGICIWVKDTGPGLPPAVVKALESGAPVPSLKQAQKWRSRGSGHGLGLNLVRDFLRSVGSSLTYLPKDRSFLFTLPKAVHRP